MTKKLVLITGASRGLGLHTTRKLGSLGYKIIFTGRDRRVGENLEIDLINEGCDVVFRKVDVIDEDSIQETAEFIKEKGWKLDVLINNAGIFPEHWDDGFFGSDAEVITKVFETNTIGAFLASKHLVPLMQDEGQVINISSGMGQLTEMNGNCLGYRISKAGANVLTKTLQAELENTNINVNSICPGWVQTDMGGTNATRTLDEGVETIVWLAQQDSSGPRGQFLRDKKPIDW